MARGRKSRRIPDWTIGLGITLIVLVLGWMRPASLESFEYRSFRGESIATIMFQITSSPPPPVTDFVPKLPPAFQEMIEKALTKDADQRFQTGAEFAAMLKAFRGQMDTVMAEPPAPPPSAGVITPRVGEHPQVDSTQRFEVHPRADSTQRFEVPPARPEE